MLIKLPTRWLIIISGGYEHILKMTFNKYPFIRNTGFVVCVCSCFFFSFLCSFFSLWFLLGNLLSTECDATRVRLPLPRLLNILTREAIKLPFRLTRKIQLSYTTSQENKQASDWATVAIVKAISAVKMVRISDQQHQEKRHTMCTTNKTKQTTCQRRSRITNPLINFNHF